MKYFKEIKRVLIKTIKYVKWSYSKQFKIEARFLKGFYSSLSDIDTIAI